MEDSVVNVKTDNIYDITNPFQSLQLEDNNKVGVSPRNSDIDLSCEESCSAKWLHVRDSLEGIAQASTSSSSSAREDRNLNQNPCAGSLLDTRHSAPARSNEHRRSVTGIHAHSDSRLLAGNPSSAGGRRHHLNLSKILSWDPWNKIGRKGKKDKGRKKGPNSVGPIQPCGSPNLGAHSSGDRVLQPTDSRGRNDEPSAPILRRSLNPQRTENIVPTENSAQLIESDNAQAQTQQDNGDRTDELHRLEDREGAGAEYDAQHENKCVRFQRDVQVVYFAGDQVLQTGLEPLRREQEQQERNKELRGRDLIGPAHAFAHATASAHAHSTSAQGIRNALRRAHSQQEHWK